MNELISSSQIKNIISRYNERLHVYGSSPLSLGWSDKTQQYLRFARFYDAIAQCKSPYSILDIGCGFGDFASFLEVSIKPPCQYIGIDINDDLLEVARINQLSFESSFYCSNILAVDNNLPLDKVKCSFAVAAGLFNYNFHGSSNKMYDFFFAMIEKMLSLCTERVVVDFIPVNRVDSYEPEPYIALYSIPIILQYLNDNGLLYSIDLLQKPNPMQEALLIIDASSAF